jgi:hypothetical protein
MFAKFDLVLLKTTKNVKYISVDPAEISPKGYWTVSNIVEDDLLITKGMAVVRIPQADVLKAVDINQSMHKIHGLLGRLSEYGEGREDS